MVPPTESAASAIQPLKLVRSSMHWTETTSAAALVMRYLIPLRRQLIEIFDSDQEADEALKLLFNHLLTAGFSGHNRGRLRDFLVKAIRSAAKARWKQRPESSLGELELGQTTADSEVWLNRWRDCLLQRAWRSLEREEHQLPGTPVYSVLQIAAKSPQQTAEMLAMRVAEERGLAIDKQTVTSTLPRSRAMFAQFVADEVAETLEQPTGPTVKQEIKTLGLTSAFVNLRR